MNSSIVIIFSILVLAFSFAFGRIPERYKPTSQTVIEFAPSEPLKLSYNNTTSLASDPFITSGNNSHFVNCKFDKADFNSLRLDKKDWVATYPCDDGKVCEIIVNFCKFTESECNGQRGILIWNNRNDSVCTIMISKKWSEVEAVASNYIGDYAVRIDEKLNMVAKPDTELEFIKYYDGAYFASKYTNITVNHAGALKIGTCFFALIAILFLL